tara:strand:- start:149 stop:664 length:516 start_codon:yes stop_codon:yes gene_type:complete
MKLTKQKLQEIIREEIKAVLSEVRGQRAFQATDLDWGAPDLGGYQQDLPGLEDTTRTLSSPDQALKNMFTIATTYQSMVRKHGGAKRGEDAAAKFDDFLEKLAELQSASDEEKTMKVRSPELQDELNMIVGDAIELVRGRAEIPAPGRTHFTGKYGQRRAAKLGQPDLFDF